MLHRRLAELLDQLVRCIEGGCRTLDHIGNAGTAQLSFLLLQTRDQPNRGFAGIGFADQVQHFAVPKVQIELMDDAILGRISRCVIHQ